jgi:hypothetical protein
MCERCDKAAPSAARAAVEGWNRAVEKDGTPERKVDFEQLTENQIQCLGRYALLALEVTAGKGACQLYIAAANGDLGEELARETRAVERTLDTLRQAVRN